MVKEIKEKKKPFLCKLGLHDDYRIIWSGDIHEDYPSGEVLQCRGCGRFRKWGTAFYPDYIKKQISRG